MYVLCNHLCSLITPYIKLTSPTAYELRPSRQLRLQRKCPTFPPYQLIVLSRITYLALKQKYLQIRVATFKCRGNCLSDNDTHDVIFIGGAIAATAVVILLRGVIILWLIRRKQRTEQLKALFDIRPPQYPGSLLARSTMVESDPRTSYRTVLVPHIRPANVRQSSPIMSIGPGLEAGSPPQKIFESQSPSSNPIVFLRSIMPGMTTSPAYFNTYALGPWTRNPPRFSFIAAVAFCKGVCSAERSEERRVGKECWS